MRKEQACPSLVHKYKGEKRKGTETKNAKL